MLAIFCLIFVPFIIQKREYSISSMFVVAALIYGGFGLYNYFSNYFVAIWPPSSTAPMTERFYWHIFKHGFYTLEPTLVLAYFAVVTKLQSSAGALFFARTTKILFWLLNLSFIFFFSYTIDGVWTRFERFYVRFACRLSLCSHRHRCIFLVFKNEKRRFS